MADPYFSNVILLLNFQGANNSTTFTDDSDAAKTVTALGNAKINTADGDWPGGVMLLDGTGDKAFVSNNYNATDPDFGTGDFTIEAFIKTTSTLKMVFEYWTLNATSWFLLINSSGRLEWRKVPSGGGAATIFLAQTSGSINTGNKVHIAVSRVSGVLYLLAGGSVLASVADTTNYVNAAQDGLTIGGWDGGTTYDINGRIGPVRITKGIGRYDATYTVPTDPFDSEGIAAVECRIADAGVLRSPSALALLNTAILANAAPLGSPSARGYALYGLVALPGVLSGERALVQHDFTSSIDSSAPTVYVMDVTGPGGTRRLPISSWQATLQTQTKSYVQCVVPACAEYVETLGDAQTFTIYRKGRTQDGADVESAMAAAPADVLELNQGPLNYTATLSGYADAFPASENPDPALDRELHGVRSVSRTSSSLRVRCAIDWLLRPGQRAFLPGGVESFIVDSISYYVPGVDQYMDLGD